MAFPHSPVQSPCPLTLTPWNHLQNKSTSCKSSSQSPFSGAQRHHYFKFFRWCHGIVQSWPNVNFFQYHYKFMDSQRLCMYQSIAFILSDAQIALSLAHQWKPLHIGSCNFWHSSSNVRALLLCYDMINPRSTCTLPAPICNQPYLHGTLVPFNQK